MHQHPQGGPALLAAVERFIADPACQVVVDPVALLAGSREPRAEQRLLSMLHAPRNDSELRGALIAWSAKPPRDNAQRRLLAEVALDWLDADSASPLVREAAADLLATVPAQVLPDGTRRRLAGQHDHRTVIAHRLNMPVVGDPPAVTRLLTALAVAATGRHHDDGLAPRLVRQALFSTDSDMRVIAANVLNTSPFRGVIADAVAELLLDPPPGTDAVTEVALVDLLGNLGSERHRPALERLLRTTPHRAVAAAFALAHMPGGTDLPVWRRVLDEHGGEGGRPAAPRGGLRGGHEPGPRGADPAADGAHHLARRGAPGEVVAGPARSAGLQRPDLKLKRPRPPAASAPRRRSSGCASAPAPARSPTATPAACAAAR